MEGGEKVGWGRGCLRTLCSIWLQGLQGVQGISSVGKVESILRLGMTDARRQMTVSDGRRSMTEGWFIQAWICIALLCHLWFCHKMDTLSNQHGGHDALYMSNVSQDFSSPPQGLLVYPDHVNKACVMACHNGRHDNRKSHDSQQSHGAAWHKNSWSSCRTSQFKLDQSMYH